MTKTIRNILLISIGVLCAVLIALLLFLLLQRPQKTAQAPTDTASQATQTSVPETTVVPTTQPTEPVFVPLDFAYEGDYLTCTSAPCIRGIDVSTFQQKVDYKKVKKAGFEFVMIRLGYRGFIQGVLFEDDWAQKNYKSAKAAGLKVGGYFFSQANTPEEAKEEAEYCMQLVKDWDVQMPIVYDWEHVRDDYRTNDVDARMLTDCTKAFCDTLEQAGYDSMFYYNPEQTRKKMYLEELTDYGFWLASYDDEMKYEYNIDMWQYTNKGKVPGISGNVDIDLYFPKDE